jgi:putative endonuclease
MSFFNPVRALRDAFARVKSRFTGGAEHMKLGRLGEDLAANALKSYGYRIAERNVKVYKREIDIVAVDGETLVFIEVKTRGDHSFGKPLEAVDKKRRERLRKAGELYVMTKKLGKASIRFDVVTVDFTDDPAGRVEIIKNAF